MNLYSQIATTVVYITTNASDAEHIQTQLNRKVIASDYCTDLGMLNPEVVILDSSHVEFDFGSSPEWVWSQVPHAHVVVTASKSNKSWTTGLLHFTSSDPESITPVIQDIINQLETNPLLHADRLFNTLVESVMDFIFLKDTNRRYLMVNKAFANHFGLTKKECLGKTDEELFGPEINLVSIESDNYVLEKLKPIIFETQYLNMAGNQTFLETIKTPLLKKGDQVEGIVGIGRDITPKKLQEELVRRNTILLKQSEQITKSGSFEYAIDLKTLTCSDQFREMLKFNPIETIQFEDLIDCIYPADRPLFIDAFGDAVDYHEPFTIEHRYRIRDTGEILDCRTSVKIDMSRNRNLLFGTIVDITEERRHGQAILDAQEGERKIIAADLHDSLTQKLVAANMYLSSIDLNKQPMDRISIANNLIKSAVEETRRLSRSLSLRSIENTGLKNALLDIVESVPLDADIFYNFDFEEEHLSSERSTHLYRIVQEAIANIMKYAGATEIKLIISSDSTLLTCSIKDNGIGFNPNNVLNGNGLKNIKQRVSKCHGIFKLRTAENAGTEIKIVIPLH